MIDSDIGSQRNNDLAPQTVEPNKSRSVSHSDPVKNENETQPVMDDEDHDQRDEDDMPMSVIASIQDSVNPALFCAHCKGLFLSQMDFFDHAVEVNSSSRFSCY